MSRPLIQDSSVRVLFIIVLFCYAYMEITVHPPDFAGDKNIDIEFPNACLLGHPFYFGYQDFKS